MCYEKDPGPGGIEREAWFLRSWSGFWIGFAVIEIICALATIAFGVILIVWAVSI